MATMVDLHRKLARIDQQTQQCEIDLMRIVASLLEAPLPLLDASLRQSIRRMYSMADIVNLANRNVIEPTGVGP